MHKGCIGTGLELASDQPSVTVQAGLTSSKCSSGRITASRLKDLPGVPARPGFGDDPSPGRH